MADKASIVSRVSGLFDWPDIDFTRIRAAIQQSVLPLFGDDYRFSAFLTRGSPLQVTQTHDSLDSLIATLSGEWESCTVNLNSPDFSRRATINFYMVDCRIRLDLEMNGPDEAPLSQVAAAFQTTMSVTAVPPPAPLARPAPPGEKTKLEGRYRLKTPDDVTTFEKLLHILEEWMGSSDRFFRGSLALISAPQFRQSPATYDEWKAKCIQEWKDVLDLNANLNGANRDCLVMYGSNRAELTVSLSSKDSKELPPLFASLEKDLPLIPAKNVLEPQFRSGERRSYFATTEINLEWFDRAMALIRGTSSEKIYFQGRFKTSVKKQERRSTVFEIEEFSRTNYEAWLSEVKSRWPNVVSLYCWNSWAEGSIAAEIDLLRDVVNIEVQSISEDTPGTVFRTLAGELKLGQFRGNPYRYRRFLRQFKIKKWPGNKNFADAVDSAVYAIFPNRSQEVRLAITTAFVAAGGEEEYLESFTDYQNFYDRLAREPEYTKATLVVEGPLGRFVGIDLDRQKKTLTLRTSLDRSELQSLIKPFTDRMDVTLELSKDEPDQKKSEVDKITKPILLATAVSVLGVIISASISILTSERGLRALSRHYSVEITYPMSVGGATVNLAGPDLLLQWKLIEQNITGDHADLRSSATISAVKEGSTQLQTFAGSQGQTVVPLTPGTWYVKVVSDVDHSSEAAINVKVPDQNPTSPPGAIDSSKHQTRETRR